MTEEEEFQHLRLFIAHLRGDEVRNVQVRGLMRAGDVSGYSKLVGAGVGRMWRTAGARLYRPASHEEAVVEEVSPSAISLLNQMRRAPDASGARLWGVLHDDGREYAQLLTDAMRAAWRDQH